LGFSLTGCGWAISTRCPC